MDSLTPSQRSERMSRIRGKDTGPELVVRRMTHAMGYRYRLRSKDLPGKPDLVFRGRRCVIFVHGCFWHRHGGCALARLPKSRTDFWREKLEGNARRDDRHIGLLQERGWRALVVWECELKNLDRVADTVRRFLEGESQ